MSGLPSGGLVGRAAESAAIQRTLGRFRELAGVAVLAARAGQEGLLLLEFAPGDHVADAIGVSLTPDVSDSAYSGPVRADRLLSLVLLLQARGRTTALALAVELEVSVRTVYRDLEALAAAGVPVLTESGPGGGCRLMDGYRFPLRGLRPDEAEALLILGVPGVLRELGLDRALDAAQRQIRVTAGSGADGGGALVHLDMPRWFGGQEEVPCLRDLAQALRSRRRLALRYQPHDGFGVPGDAEPRVVGPLGLVNKAGLWYLVASVDGSAAVRVFRGGRIISARVLAEPFERPAGFELGAFWRRWSAEFEPAAPGSRSRSGPRPGRWRCSVRYSARPPGRLWRRHFRRTSTAGGSCRCPSSTNGPPRTAWPASGTRWRCWPRRRSGTCW